MPSQRGISKIYTLTALFSWVILLFIDIKSVDYQLIHRHDSIGLFLGRNILLTLFIISLFLYHKLKVGSIKGDTFPELLWKTFVVGLTTLFGIGILRAGLAFFDSQNILSEDPYFVNILYYVNIGLMMYFISHLFYVFKRMVLYQKSKRLEKSWRYFEPMFFALTALNFFQLPINEVYSLPYFIFIGVFIIISLFLSYNLKWVVYLNFQQKWRSIIFLLLIVTILGFFVQYSFTRYEMYSSMLTINIISKPIILFAFSFLFIYSISSTLVILFNLPTSSVFEKKFGDVLNFQQLSKSLKTGEKEEKIYDIILDRSINTVMADAAWLQIDNEENSIIKTQGIEEAEIPYFKRLLNKTGEQLKTNQAYINNIKKNDDFKSIISIPLSSPSKDLGYICLLKNVKDGFDNEIVDILKTFLWQSSVAIENSRLVNEAIKNERYKEEMKIAKEVQKRLLPPVLLSHDKMLLTAVSITADEVGGDYYDIHRFSNTKFAVIIGDVSGHGTKAAFYMAQMKGIFQSLIQLDLTPKDLLSKANTAISNCLGRKSFITLSLFYIDLEASEITYARAGHCPTLYHDAVKNKTFYFENKGLGLGILRNDKYRQHIEEEHYAFNGDDVVVLYTDGIIEATNEQGEEFGYDKLKNIIHQNAQKEPKEITKNVIDELYRFSHDAELEDDHTLLIVKFIK